MSNSNDSLSKVVINWYPGHMVKAKREVEQTLKLIDIVIELLDSRIPISSKNPDIDKLIANKKRIVVLNKCDLSNEEENIKWINYYNSIGINAVLVDSLTGFGMKKLIDLIYKLNEENNQKNIEKGILGKSIRIAVLGIPNVGKSSFINKFVKKGIAKVGNRPGVTKSNQWIRINKDIILLDTPGMLWPKFEEKIGLNLSFTGCIKEEIMDIETISYLLLERLSKHYKDMIYERYKIEPEFTFNDTTELLDKIGQKRGCIMSGGRIDYNKLGHIILDEFQLGKIGKITLERVEDIDV